MEARGTTRRRPIEPLLWLVFSSGGLVAALVAPILLLLLGLAFPLGWIEAPHYPDLLALVRNPLTRLVVFGIVALSLAHWAHRFRYTLWDGLQLKHGVINVLCYGAALVGTLWAAIVVLSL